MDSLRLGASASIYDLSSSECQHSARLRTAAAYPCPGALTFKLSVSSPKHLKIYHRKTSHTFVHLHPISASSASPPSSGSNSNGNRRLLLLACSSVTVALAIANRVLYKLALVPMKEFPFFLAQLTTFGYVAVYFAVLYMRYQADIVTDEMLAFPKSRFIIIGFLEALGVVSGMYSGANLPGPAIPILSQTFLVWQLAFSMLLLGRSYSLNRVAGCFLVAAGVVIAVASGSEQEQILSGVGVVWPTLMIASSAFQAVASILKESVFLNAATHLKGKLLDIFVVNSFGSGFQALFVLLFLPFLSNLKGIPLSELPSYMKSGAACFLNIGANTTGNVFIGSRHLEFSCCLSSSDILQKIVCQRVPHWSYLIHQLKKSLCLSYIYIFNFLKVMGDLSGGKSDELMLAEVERVNKVEAVYILFVWEKKLWDEFEDNFYWTKF